MAVKKITKNKVRTIKKNIRKNYFYLFFITILVVIISAFIVKESNLFGNPKVIKTVIKQTLVRRSVDQGFINNALTGRAVDVNTGKIVQAARIFSPNDRKVYLELDLNLPPVGTVVDYIRYKDGRYVDHG